MWKKKLQADLLGSVVNFKSVLKDLRKQRLSGFVKAEGWDFADYIIFFEGSPLRAIRKKHLRNENLNLTTYSPPEDTKLSIYETHPLLTAHILKEFSFPKYQTLILSGYGEEVFFSRLDMIDFVKLCDFLRKSGFTGYITLYTPSKILGNLFYVGGEPKAINSGKLWNEEALNYIFKYSGVKFLSAYHIPPEELYVLLSLKHGYKEGENSTGLIISESGSIQIVHDNLIINTLRILPEGIAQEDTKEIKEGVFYALDYTDNFPSINVALDNLQLEEEFVKENVLDRVKEVFIDCIGPVGSILFDRMLSEYTDERNRISKSNLQDFITRLKEEIPEEYLQEEFYDKVKEVIE